jgi:hypothetical protein
VTRYVPALLLGATIALVAGGSVARAAAPPTLTVEVIGNGQVTGTGISCGAGSLTCYATYSSAQMVTLTPTASTGWTFTGWQDDCGPTCSVGATGNLTATAVFSSTAPTVQTATYGVSVAGKGTIANGSTTNQIDCAPNSTPAATACSLTVPTGSTLTVAEQADTGFFFSSWGGACSGASPSCSAYVTANTVATAEFLSSAPQQLSVTVSGNGSVSGGGISCGAGSTCTAYEPPNATVTLAASPGDGYGLTGWSGGSCTGTQSTCTVQMDGAARSVTATFAPLVRLSVTVSGNGTVSGGGIGCGPGSQTCTASELPNTSVALTATPSSGGTVFWSGCSTSSGPNCTVSIGTSPVSVTATFTGGSPPPVSTDSLSVSVLGNGAVASTAGTAAIYCTAAGGSGCSANVTAGTSLTLTALPASGTVANFTGWTGDCSAFTSTTCTLTMNSAKTVGANFAGGNTTYQLSAQVIGSGSISGAGLSCTSSGGSGCAGPQPASASVTITATPAVGATFSGWSGACSGSSATCTVSMTTAKSVTATFASGLRESNQRLALKVAGPGTVTVAGVRCTSTGAAKACSHDYVTGTVVAVSSTPAKGALFSGWSGACSGRKSLCFVTMSGPETVDAKFSPLLEARRSPVVATAAGGHRITLSFTAHESGTVKLVEARSGKRFATKTFAIRAGARRITVTVARTGRYVFTATLSGKLGVSTLRWTVRV